MSGTGVPTFDQLRIFEAVADTGSFAAAGRRLNRATSVISYGIANLEAQLGVMLFNRQGRRRPQLTTAGRAVLAEARTIGFGMDRLRARVAGLQQGLEAEVGLAVDVFLPTARLAGVLRAFSQAFPTVALSLHVEALGAVADLVLTRRAVIGVAGSFAARLPGLDSVALYTVPLIPVAAPGHPLAQGPPAPGMGRDHVQLVLSDRSDLTRGQDFAVLSPHTWRVADLGAKHALLKEGIGWGNMPTHMVEADIAAGRLVRLAMPDQPEATHGLSLIHRTDTPPGPAAAWLMQRLLDWPG